MPAIIGKYGVESLVPIELSAKETEDLHNSAAVLEKTIVDVFG